MLADLGRAGFEMKRLAKKVMELQEENQKLRFGEYAINYAPEFAGLKERIKQLEWEVEARGKKVELPGHVAEAIEKFREESVIDAEIFKLGYVDGSADGEWAARLTAFMRRSRENPKVIMAALVNGYTVAPEPENDEAADLLKEVTSLVWDWWHNPPAGGKPQHHVERLAEKVCDYIQQREALPF